MLYEMKREKKRGWKLGTSGDVWNKRENIKRRIGTKKPEGIKNG